MTSGEHFRGGKVLEVLVIGYDVYWDFGTLEVVSPDLEGLEYCKKLFVVRVVVEFRGRESVRMESNRSNGAIGKNVRENSSNSIIGSVGFDDPGQRWIKVMKNGCARKGAFERLEAQLGMLVEVPRSVLARDRKSVV